MNISYSHISESIFALTVKYCVPKGKFHHQQLSQGKESINLKWQCKC